MKHDGAAALNRVTRPYDTGVIPGGILYTEGDVIINEGLEVTTIRVANTSDRPIQIGSHFHFAEVNAALEFDRDAAWGRRLAALSGGVERFEPGAVAEVDLVPIQGKRIVLGLRGLCRGRFDNAKVSEVSASGTNLRFS